MVPVNRISRSTWRAWSEILAGAPGTRLLLNCVELGEAARRHVLEKMPAGDIGQDRIIWVASRAASNACEAWQAADLGLCPLTGDSSYSALLGLWMGVPSIAIDGGAAPWGRHAGDALHRLGLSAYVTRTTEQYVSLATRLATQAKEPATIEPSLRERLKNSPFTDTDGFAAAFGSALVGLWQQRGGSTEGEP
jgi:predicted O-linked N-acetylglucosamine transferase (SPINDLY family)